ncbi:hypothetical protein CONPUDRAFT_81161 [Coniophora puteana RWD-64-598 SS2]|uniref:Uncharacterized protein n=1 Tax=Coniophora puteana (strain RWD-64-598) TaxID=741705 RepID=A0A5M3MWV1_CONPW|nr:uncharacterized protein CONPUDRAFT_81161 [Coniophora puteana RWD-64-598 SS2]EIW83081.1 hypothetical protein CONPUDRAFT_81161 [Coniophora puteana RWD-64-598 SS2]
MGLHWVYRGPVSAGVCPTGPTYDIWMTKVAEKQPQKQKNLSVELSASLSRAYLQPIFNAQQTYVSPKR